MFLQIAWRTPTQTPQHIFIFHFNLILQTSIGMHEYIIKKKALLVLDIAQQSSMLWIY